MRPVPKALYAALAFSISCRLQQRRHRYDAERVVRSLRRYVERAGERRSAVDASVSDAQRSHGSALRLRRRHEEEKDGRHLRLGVLRSRPTRIRRTESAQRKAALQGSRRVRQRLQRRQSRQPRRAQRLSRRSHGLQRPARVQDDHGQVQGSLRTGERRRRRRGRERKPSSSATSRRAAATRWATSPSGNHGARLYARAAQLPHRLLRRRRRLFEDDRRLLDIVGGRSILQPRDLNVF